MIPRSPRRKVSGARASRAPKQPCEICGTHIAASGMHNHKKACLRNRQGRDRDAYIMHLTEVQEHQEAAILESGYAPADMYMPLVDTTSATGSSVPSRNPSAPATRDNSPAPGPSTVLTPPDPAPTAARSTRSTPANAVDPPISARRARPTNVARSTPAADLPDPTKPVNPNDSKYGLDDVFVQYHPHSQTPSHVTPLEDFTRTPVLHEIPRPYGTPWAPFATRTDFEFADLCRRCQIGSKATEELIQLIRGIAEDRGSFTLRSEADLASVWEAAARSRTAFENATITAKLRNVEHSYEMYYRPIWEWVKDLVSDPTLAPHFNWDAQKLHIFDGSSWVRFRDEPWTADRWWELQSELPEGANMVGIIFYADKTNLTTFGDQKGYPIVVRCANLPVHIRNSNGHGGGRVVGWLPIVDGDTSRDSFEEADFKRIIWHEASWKCLESLIGPAQFGEWMKAGDGVDRWLFPVIILVSSDYEEQCVIAGNRGTRCLKPCCVCHTLRDMLFHYQEHFVKRTHEESQQLYREAQALLSKTARNEYLKPFGLRFVNNVFWRIPHLNIYLALSFDRLHTNHLGIWKTHLWAELKQYILSMGVNAERTVNQQCDSFPRWRNLKHITSITNVTFSDGSTYEDMSKIILFVTHNIINEDDHPQGYALLKCIRSYLNLDLYLSFEVQTDTSIEAARAELRLFMQLLTDYVSMVPTLESTKDWNFPKIYLLMHSIDDMLAKGATRNMNTKPNEQLHHILKSTYQNMTNFKNVATQILHHEHRNYVAEHIRAILKSCDEFDKAATDAKHDAGPLLRRNQFGNVTLGSQKRSITLGMLESERRTDRAFSGFRRKLTQYVTSYFALHNLPLPPDGIKLMVNTKITEFQLLKTYFTSTIDW
ncbi:hypothetical protein CERSUDRAFT_113535, partial [Gelatoporia subvermispora B]